MPVAPQSWCGRFGCVRVLGPDARAPAVNTGITEPSSGPARNHIHARKGARNPLVILGTCEPSGSIASGVSSFQNPDECAVCLFH